MLAMAHLATFFFVHIFAVPCPSTIFPGLSRVISGSLHDEICVGAHYRLSEVPTCPSARVWLEVASCFQVTSSIALSFCVSRLNGVSLDHHVRSRLVPPCLPPGPILCLCPGISSPPCWSHFLVACNSYFLEALPHAVPVGTSRQPPRTVLSMWPESVSPCCQSDWLRAVSGSASTCPFSAALLASG